MPEVIVQQGGNPVIQQLGVREFSYELRKLLRDRAAEYYQSGQFEDLVDIAETIYALARTAGLSEAQFEALRQKKLAERGGFEQRILLVEISYD
jgi:predicted house-cleaning noncanonical NTP pyrophosphatase (MazG superfamily)